MTQRQTATRPHAQALQVWLDDHGDALWRFAVSRVGQQHAEDIVQETLLAALKAAASFEGRSSAETWLLGIMSNKVVDHYRRRARAGAVASIDPTHTEDLPPEPTDEFNRRGKWARKPGNWDRAAPTAETPGEDPLRTAYRACMDKLPDILKDALELRELRDLPPDTVCQALGISATNLWTRLHRARASLRKCIDSTLNPPPAPRAASSAMKKGSK